MLKLFRKPIKKYFYRVRIEWNRVWKDSHALLPSKSYKKMKESIFQEHQYKFPEPHWIWMDMQSAPTLKITPAKIFTDIYLQNIQIALTREGKELGLSTALEDFWTAYSYFTPTFIEILDMPVTEIENYAKTGYLYQWYHRGGQTGESSVDIGHACCTMHIFLNSPKFLLTWWERESAVLNRPELVKWAEQIQKDLETIFHIWNQSKTDTNGRFEKFVSEFFIKAYHCTQQARAESPDPELHFYQNPKWEKFYSKREGLDWVKEHFSKNRHPDSLKWIKTE